MGLGRPLVLTLSRHLGDLNHSLGCLPLRTTSLPQRPGLQPSTTVTVWSFTGGRGISPPEPPNQCSTPPTISSQVMLRACFGWNQLLPALIGLSPLDAGHASDLQINTACGPPSLVRFRDASTCPRLDRPASGRAVTPRTLYVVPHNQGCCADMLVSLRLPKDKGLASPQQTLPGPFFKTDDTTLVSDLLILQCRHWFLHKSKIPFMPYRAITIWFQALFTSL